MTLRYLVLTGCPRSGTSVLKKVLRGHDSIASFGIEHGYLLELLDRFGHEVPSPEAGLSYVEESQWFRGTEVASHAREHWGAGLGESIALTDFIARLHHLALGSSDPKYVLLQYPGTGILRYQEVQRLLGDVSFVVLTRDPRANVASQLASFSPGRSALRATRLWLQCERAGQTLADDPNATSFAVRYEALVQGSEETLRRLCDWLGLTYSAALRDFEVSMPIVSGDRSVERQLFSSFDESLVDKWRRNLRGDQQWLIETLARDQMKRHGYFAERHRFRPSWLGPIARDVGRLGREKLQSMARMTGAQSMDER